MTCDSSLQTGALTPIQEDDVASTHSGNSDSPQSLHDSFIDTHRSSTAVPEEFSERVDPVKLVDLIRDVEKMKRRLTVLEYQREVGMNYIDCELQKIRKHIEEENANVADMAERISQNYVDSELQKIMRHLDSAITGLKMHIESDPTMAEAPAAYLEISGGEAEGILSELLILCDSEVDTLNSASVLAKHPAYTSKPARSAAVIMPLEKSPCRDLGVTTAEVPLRTEEAEPPTMSPFKESPDPRRSITRTRLHTSPGAHCRVENAATNALVVSPIGQGSMLHADTPRSLKPIGASAPKIPPSRTHLLTRASAPNMLPDPHRRNVGTETKASVDLRDSTRAMNHRFGSWMISQEAHTCGSHAITPP